MSRVRVRVSSGLGVFHALLEEAETSAHYVPVGGYRVFLPEELALRHFLGLQALCVWHEPTWEERGWWVRLEGTEGEGAVFWWSLSHPERNPNPRLIPEVCWPLLAATLAALHRDLRVAGESVMIENWPRAGERPARGGGG